MKVVHFRYHGKFGHFLRAESTVDGLTYPVPTRTALQGLVGAVLGLNKDEPQLVLAEAKLAVAGPVPHRFWHKTNVRKDPPAALPYTVKRRDRGTAADERNMRFAQEWLWQPDFHVWAALPATVHEEFASRLRTRRWHFSPSLGLSELLAQLDHLEDLVAMPLPQGVHRIGTVAPQEAGEIDRGQAAADGLTLQALRMLSGVTADRVFSHRTYWVEIKGRPFPLETAQAWQCEGMAVVWL